MCYTNKQLFVVDYIYFVQYRWFYVCKCCTRLDCNYRKWRIIILPSIL